MNTLQPLEPTVIPAEDEAFRAEVRAFVAEATANIPAASRARSWSGFDLAFTQALAERGWLGLTFPKAYGGSGRSAFARYVLVEEMLNAGAPVAAHWIGDRQSGPLLLKYGTEAQKQRFLPAICRGEAFFCIGMSEPNSGSDLASVRSRATPQEDGGWILNGQKIWTTHAQHCHFMIALVRTSGGPGDRHAGLSQVIVDLSLPGISVVPIKDLSGDAHFCEVFFDNVKLDADAIVGTEGNGWEQVMAELAFERSGPERFYTSIVLFDEWLTYIRTPQGFSERSQTLAGKILSQLAPIRSLSIAITEKLERGESPAVEAALTKDLGTCLEQAIPEMIADDLFARNSGDLPAQLLGALQYTTLSAPSYSLRGGTRDILRGMIARGLGLR